ncbi:MAG: hypothetical protein B6244_02685 [Candidatus Cloacimonetes bacterium 4572_55]|nr:MAG: hypothetical protein B6244_02685 [Candidatus Cloacimonetes bacterium 4572_55]
MPPDVDLEETKRKILSIPKVLLIHHTHIWSLDGERHVLTTHTVVERDCSRESALEIKNNIRELAAAGSVVHLTIEIEFEGESCSMNHAAEVA